jgi:hypothetical protein
MGRTRQEIAQGMKEEFMSSQPLIELYGLDTTVSTDFDHFFSVVSVEAIIINTIAFATYLHEQMWDTFRTLIQGIVDNQYVMSFAWYKAKALAFQNGYKLAFNTNSNQYSYGYETIDTEAQIVKYCAVRQVTNQSTNVTELHVLFSGEGKQAITGNDYNAFCDYMREVGAAGIHYVFISQNPDPVALKMTIIYDRQLMRADGTTFNGDLNSVKQAVDAFFENIEYGGNFRVSDLVAAIKEAEGVNDCIISKVEQGNPLEETTAAKLEAVSGAFTFDIENSSITYTADELE